MANFGFIIDNRRCIGCHACTVACKAEHDVPIGVNRTWVKYIEQGQFPNSQRLFSVMRCNHCDNAPCVEICPVSALYTRHDGIVDFDNRRCIGCKACMQACPYDALYIDPNTHTAAKCNYCAHRVDVGLEPACVNVCPTQAIVSGDLDNPESRIAKLKTELPVKARKVEKGTEPALFYIDAEDASLDPLQAPAADQFMWGQQSAGVGHFADHGGESDEHALEKLARLLSFGEGSAKLSGTESASQRASAIAETLSNQPKRAYDAPQKGILWGWQVSGYLWTKSIAAGIIVAVLLARMFSAQLVSQSVELSVTLVSLVFLGLTGGLLVWDLDQPKRFLYVLLRPQWRSWLVRGAYIITAFSLMLVLNLALVWFSFLSQPHWWLTVPLIVGGLLTAVYTAFLFAQARGRGFWQSKTVPLHMVTHSLIAGSAVMLLASSQLDPGLVSFLKVLLLITATIHLAMTLIELVLPHEDQESAIVASSILGGRYSRLFWMVAIAFGVVVPGLLALVMPTNLLAIPATMFLIGIFASQHIWVRAPQQIPLS